MKDTGQTSGLKSFWAVEHGAVGVYAGVFFQAFLGGIWLVTMPFIIKRLSGSDFDVGLCIGLGFLGYVVALVGCLFGRVVLDRFSAKRTVQLGVGAITALMAAAYLTVVEAEKGYCGNSAILVLTVLSTIQGLMTAMFWPGVVGWLSREHEGSELNRRLGIFNVSWSLAGIISPYVGGYLVEINSTLPLMACIVMGVLSFTAVSFAHKPQRLIDIVGSNGAKAYGDGMYLLRRQFMWMGRIALLTSFVCIGLMRTQLALLFKFKLGFSELSYGVAIMVMSVAIFVVFFAAGKTHIWHYVLSIFLGAQGLLLLSMLLILNGVGLWELFLAAGLAGGGQAFLYSSHLYYGISSARNRSGRMAIHEITLAVGFLIGSVVGGYLSDNFGRYVPYWFGFGIVVAGLLAQSAVWFLHRANQK